jgi:hypothetical protein
MDGLNSVSASTNQRKKLDWNAIPINVGVDSPMIDMCRIRESNARNMRAWRLAKFDNSTSTDTAAKEDSPKDYRIDRRGTTVVTVQIVKESTQDTTALPPSKCS